MFYGADSDIQDNASNPGKMREHDPLEDSVGIVPRPTPVIEQLSPPTYYQDVQGSHDAKRLNEEYQFLNEGARDSDNDLVDCPAEPEYERVSPEEPLNRLGPLLTSCAVEGIGVHVVANRIKVIPCRLVSASSSITVYDRIWPALECSSSQLPPSRHLQFRHRNVQKPDSLVSHGNCRCRFLDRSASRPRLSEFQRQESAGLMGDVPASSSISAAAASSPLLNASSVHIWPVAMASAIAIDLIEIAVDVLAPPRDRVKDDIGVPQSIAFLQRDPVSSRSTWNAVDPG